MSSTDTDFDYGDWVESKLNTDVFGIIVDANGHDIIFVQLAPSLQVRGFHKVTLRHMDEDDIPDDGGTEENPDAEVDSNVIDFTRAKRLRAATKTRGAA